MKYQLMAICDNNVNVFGPVGDFNLGLARLYLKQLNACNYDFFDDPAYAELRPLVARVRDWGWEPTICCAIAHISTAQTIAQSVLAAGDSDRIGPGSTRARNGASPIDSRINYSHAVEL